MADFPIATRTIEIESDGDINIIDRSTSTIIDTYSLNEKRYNFSKSESNFHIIGHEDDIEGSEKVSETSCEGNEVSMNTDYQLTGTGSEIDFSEYTVQIKLNQGTLEFWQAQ